MSLKKLYAAAQEAAAHIKPATTAEEESDDVVFVAAMINDEGEVFLQGKPETLARILAHAARESEDMCATILITAAQLLKEGYGR